MTQLKKLIAQQLYFLDISDITRPPSAWIAGLPRSMSVYIYFIYIFVYLFHLLKYSTEATH